MLSSIRWLTTSFAFHSGVTYAAFIALRRPSEIGTLKLWMLLSVITALSYAFGDVLALLVPMFMELRAILVWGLILMEPVGWVDAYDTLCAPFLLFVVGSLRDASRSGYTRNIFLAVSRLFLLLTAQLLRIGGSLGALRDPSRVESLLDGLLEEIAESKRCISKATQ